MSVDHLASLCNETLSGSTLVEIENEAEYIFFKNLMKQSARSYDVISRVLLGARYNQFDWRYLDTDQPISYEDWYDGHGVPGDCQYLMWGSQEGMHPGTCGPSGLHTRLACQVIAGF